MINKLWTDVSLENYNNWYPLTGKIIETPQQYINTWPNVNDWFTTFAIRAQNDINAYLDFILSKFPFDSFKDELIKETLRDMVYVCVEHWVFNRTPIEFNVDATIQFNNGTSFSANSIPSINVWDLAPSRMKIWARLTELKQVFLNYSEDELDVDKIDLQAFYTKNQVDELIKEQKAFTLSKQMKLYDDLVDDNVDEIYRGPVSKFVNKGYVATEYDKETETMILDWPDEIGTLPPEALQNNPQIGDFIHAATADFSAKQQKRITTNENEITKLNSELTKINESIDDIKNNWFNIATSPLWKKMPSFIPSSEFGKIYLAIWGYFYQSTTNPTDNYIYSNKKTIFSLGGEIQRTTQTSIKLDELIVNNNVKIQLLFTKEWNDITVTSNDVNYQPMSVALYQYIGKGTPTEFIAEDSTEHDYYTKQETNDLLDKKQDKLKNSDDVNINKNNTISIFSGNNTQISNNVAYNNQYQKLNTNNKTIVSAINENKVNIDKKQDKLIAGENIKIENNVISATGGSSDSLWNQTPEDVNLKLAKDINLQGYKLTRVGDPIQEDDGANKRYVDNFKEQWKNVGTKISDTQINYNFINQKTYKITYTVGTIDNAKMYKKFIYTGKSTILETIYTDSNTWTRLHVSSDNKVYTESKTLLGYILLLEELQEENIYKINSKTLNITSPTLINMQKPIKIDSKTLLTNELEENNWEIEQKENPIPTPCPCPKWKDVAISQDGGKINYQLKSNTFYRIFYDNNDKRDSTKIGKYPMQTIEIFWQENSSRMFYLPESYKNSYFQILNNNLIYWRKGDGNLWKLQELQG